jgi:hypothetical protein
MHLRSRAKADSMKKGAQRKNQGRKEGIIITARLQISLASLPSPWRPDPMLLLAFARLLEMGRRTSHRRFQPTR